MAIQTLEARFSGFSPLLQNNPRTVDPFDKYAVMKKPLSAKRKKTDEDILELRKIEIESKVFWDEGGVYVPTRWVMASLAKNAYSIAKISKDKIRGAVFTTTSKAKLTYDGMEQVKEITDISKNERFNTLLILPQQNVRLAKAFPIFHKWSFTVGLEYDDTVVDLSSLKSILTYAAKYNGFGDFRPSYGRAELEIIND